MMPDPTPVTADLSCGGSSSPGDYTRRAAAVLGASIILTIALLPLDGVVGEFCRRFYPNGDLALRGDLKRVVSFLEYFGDAMSSMVFLACVLLQDLGQRRRLLDWLAGVVVSSGSVYVLKIALARPRPRILYGLPKEGFESPMGFRGPFLSYPIPKVGLDGSVVYSERYSWQFWHDVSGLWSSPSGHSAAAMVLAVVMSSLYPRLKPLAFSLASCVAVARVLMGAHFPSDVVLGAGVGYAAATMAMGGCWGQRVFPARATKQG